jgi:HSP20 family protein
MWRRPGWERDLVPELRDFERAMNRVFGAEYPRRAEYPPVNVWTGKDDIVVTAELPGLEAEDLDISIHGDLLTLRCTGKEAPAQEGETYHRRECAHGSFARSWRLPFEVERDKVEAKLQDGVLRLTLPRSEASRPRKVQIQTTQRR